MNRALDEPNSPVIVRSTELPMPLNKPEAASQIFSNVSIDIGDSSRCASKLLPIKRRRNYAVRRRARIGAHFKRKFSQPLSLTLLFAMGQWQCVLVKTVHFAMKTAAMASPWPAHMPATLTDILSGYNTKRSAGRRPETAFLSHQKRETLQQQILSTDFRGQLVFLGTGTSVGVPMVGCGCAGLHKHQLEEPAHAMRAGTRGCPTEIC